MKRPKAWIAWSSGKDSAWTLHVARQQEELEVVGMLTTVTEPYDRVSMHGVRNELVEAQAHAIDLPIHRALIPALCSNEEYEAAMREVLQRAKAEGVTHVVFGDLFLEDVRDYREKKLGQAGMTPAFPLWGLDTKRLAREMVQGGLRAYITCLDSRKLPLEFAGHAFDQAFLDALPKDVDPSGENGEFHTFVYDGPMFGEPIDVELGETVEREGFVFRDVLLAKTPEP